MSNSQQEHQHALILAELKAIKALISEIGIQKINGAAKPPSPQASIPVIPAPEKSDYIRIGNQVRVPYDGVWVTGTVENVNSFHHQALIRINSTAILALRTFGDIFPWEASILDLPPAVASPAVIIESSKEAPVVPTPRDKFLALIVANKFDEAEIYLTGCANAELQTWEPLPAEIELPNVKLFTQACRRGELVNLETTTADNLVMLFNKDMLPEDRTWFKNRITPVTAARLRGLEMSTGLSVLPVVEFLCTSPCCLDRMQFAWELLDTEGNPIFPAADFWRHTDFLKGDITNPDFVRWWAKNVMAAQEMPDLME